MGGFNTAFVATHTHDIFAAAVAGAPITDLVSYYGDHHWGSGIAETDHIETGQERMEVALYEDFQAYVDNSPVFGAHDMTVPLLLEAGDEDGTWPGTRASSSTTLPGEPRRTWSCWPTWGRDTGWVRKRTNGTTSSASWPGSDTT